MVSPYMLQWLLYFTILFNVLYDLDCIQFNTYINVFLVFRCNLCCCSVGKASCGCRNGTWRTLTSWRRRLPASWSPQCWQGSLRCVRSSSGKTSKWFTRGGFWNSLDIYKNSSSSACLANLEDLYIITSCWSHQLCSSVG